MSTPTDNDLATFRSPSSLSNRATQFQLLKFVDQINNIKRKLQEGKTSFGGVPITWNCGISRNFKGTVLSAVQIFGYAGSNGPYPGIKLTRLIIKVQNYIKNNEMSRIKNDQQLFYPGSTLQELSSPSVSYSLSTTSDVSYEDEFTITLSSSNVANGTIVGYNITGIDSADINNASLNGFFTVVSNSSTLTLTNTNEESSTQSITITLSEYDTNGSETGSVSTGANLLRTATYNLYSSSDAVNEGETFTITLTSSDVDDSTTVGYTITGVTSSDINNESLTGEFTVISNIASKLFTTTTDLTTEGTETFTITLDSTDSTGSSTGSPSTSVVISDTSQEPVVYTLTASTDTAREGDEIIFTVGANVLTGTTVGYTFSGISSDDIGEALTGLVTITSDVGTKSVTITSDFTTEGSETMTFTLDPTDSANNITSDLSVSVTILDTSTDQYSLSFVSDVVSFGQTFTVDLSSISVPDSTTVGYTVSGVIASDINNVSLTGQFTIIDNSASEEFTITTSDSKEFTITLDGSDSTGSTNAASSSIFVNALYDFTTQTFTNAGATGRTGPTYEQITETYTSDWTTNTDFLNMDTQGIQVWTVPMTSTYRVITAGAAGGTHGYSGNVGGTGAVIIGEFEFTQGDKIRIVVGQMGGDSLGGSSAYDNAAPGGGGASYVYYYATDSLPLMAAGGGAGGSKNTYSLKNANDSSTSGNDAQDKDNNGSDGNGGRSNTGGSSYWAGAGAGWITDGTGGNNSTNYNYNPGSQGAYGGRAPRNGGEGGIRWNDGNDEGGDGGFGGGGGGGSDNMGTGGGAGYSGGGGANSSPSNGNGGGGGSYNSGDNSSTGTANTSHGYVTITRLSN